MRGVLRNQKIFHQRRQCLIRGTLWSAITSLGGRREHLNNKNGIHQRVNAFDSLENEFATPYTCIWIPIRRQLRCFDRCLSGECAAVLSRRLLSQDEVCICPDGVMPLRAATHAHDATVPILVARVTRPLDSEILFE